MGSVSLTRPLGGVPLRMIYAAYSNVGDVYNDNDDDDAADVIRPFRGAQTCLK